MSSELDRVPRGNPEELVPTEDPSGFSVGWDIAQLSYGEGVDEEVRQNINNSYEDYSENKEFYDAWANYNPRIGFTDSAKETGRLSYNRAVDRNIFELDAEGNIQPGAGHFIGAELLYQNDVLKGILLAKRNGYSEDIYNQEYSKVTEAKSMKLGKQREGVSAWGLYPGILAGHIVQPETLIDFISPSKVMAGTVTKGAAKAFAVEAGIAMIGETMREQRIRSHMEKADLEYTLWDSVENILIGSGLAGFIRGIGSAVTDVKTIKKINAGITNKTDKEIFARFARRENYKLTTNSNKHLALLEKAREDINAGRPADIADHTDIDINTKTDDLVEEVSLAEEVKASSNVSPEEIKQFEDTIDNTPPPKDATEADPYEGMATIKEADETIQEVIDDPEIKAMFDEVKVEKKRLSSQAQRVQDAKLDNRMDLSEDEAKQEVKNLFKKNKQDEFKNYSAEDIDELDRLFREDQEMQVATKEIEAELNSDVAGVGGTSVFAQFGPEMFVGSIAGFDKDEEGNITFDPTKFILGMLAGHAAKYSVLKTKAFTKPGLKPSAKKKVDNALEKLKKEVAEKYLSIALKKKLDPKLIKQLQYLTEKRRAK